MAQGLTYAVDLVLVIDATGSMAGVFGRANTEAMLFHDSLRGVMVAKHKPLDELRARVVVFRDFYAGDAVPLDESKFFSLPAEQESFADFMTGIRASGGGDEPENGLEALVTAIRSHWSRSGTKRRHVIVVWTDASSHPLEKNAGQKPAGYPALMPEDFDALTDLWEGQDFMDANAKRLVIFAPDVYPWAEISTNWESVVHFPSNAGEGMSEFDYATILEAIANSI